MSENNKCVILVPCYGGIDPETEKNLREAERAGYRVWRLPDFSSIGLARSVMADRSLDGNYDGFLWVDGDMGFDISAVHKLRNSGYSVISAVCPMKEEKGRPCLMGAATTNLNDPVTKVEYVGTGFLYTESRVYRDIIAEFKMQKLITRCGPTYPFFMDMEENGIYLTEDFAFCSRAKSAGHAIMVDTTIPIRHYGRYAYTWKRDESAS